MNESDCVYEEKYERENKQKKKKKKKKKKGTSIKNMMSAMTIKLLHRNSHSGFALRYHLVSLTHDFDLSEHFVSIDLIFYCLFVATK